MPEFDTEAFLEYAETLRKTAARRDADTRGCAAPARPTERPPSSERLGAGQRQHDQGLPEGPVVVPMPQHVPAKFAPSACVPARPWWAASGPWVMPTATLAVSVIWLAASPATTPPAPGGAVAALPHAARRAARLRPAFVPGRRVSVRAPAPRLTIARATIRIEATPARPALARPEGPLRSLEDIRTRAATAADILPVAAPPPVAPRMVAEPGGVADHPGARETAGRREASARPPHRLDLYGDYTDGGWAAYGGDEQRDQTP